MAFETTNISNVSNVTISGRDGDDGALLDLTTCMTNGDTETSCDEIKNGSEGLRIQFDIPSTGVTALTIRFWDDGAMTVGDYACMPYTDTNSVSTTNEIVTALVKDSFCDFVLDAAFLADLGDADGSGNFAVRLAIANGSSAKPKASEVEYEIVASSSSYYT